MVQTTLSSQFRRIDPLAARIVLVDMANRVLGTFAEGLSEAARKHLEQLGVEVRLGHGVDQIDQDGVVRLGSEPPDKIVIGGRFAFDKEGAEWLRGALPTKIHIPASSPAAGPLSATLSLMRSEPCGTALGNTIMFDRLADILLIQAIRAHLAMAGPQAASWLYGLTDPRIGAALRRFHSDVAADWKQRLATRTKTTTAGTGEKTAVTVERLGYLDEVVPAIRHHHEHVHPPAPVAMPARRRRART